MEETPRPSGAIKEIETGGWGGMCSLVEELSLFIQGKPGGGGYLSRTQGRFNFKCLGEVHCQPRGVQKSKEVQNHQRQVLLE